MGARTSIRILLVDDHVLVREGIRSSFKSYTDLKIVGEAGDGPTAVELAKSLKPEVILMDITLPGMNGIEATQIIMRELPQTRIIALSVHDRREMIFPILRAGAQAYVLKDTSPAELAGAIRAVVKGSAFFSPAVSQLLLHNMVHPLPHGSEDPGTLSGRERTVLERVAAGQTNKEIALEFGLSVRTVETYRLRIMRKLQARNVAELLKHARDRRLLP